MEIKVGQWFRTYGGAIKQCKIENKPYEANGKMWYFTQNYYNEVVKVADTPQELAEVNDLVFYQRPAGLNGRRHNLIVEKYDWQYVTESHDYISASNIIKILTPNSKGGYDLQWESK